MRGLTICIEEHCYKVLYFKYMNAKNYKNAIKINLLNQEKNEVKLKKDLTKSKSAFTMLKKVKMCTITLAFLRLCKKKHPESYHLLYLKGLNFRLNLVTVFAKLTKNKSLLILELK